MERQGLVERDWIVQRHNLVTSLDDTADLALVTHVREELLGVVWGVVRDERERHLRRHAERFELRSEGFAVIEHVCRTVLLDPFDSVGSRSRGDDPCDAEDLTLQLERQSYTESTHVQL